MCVSRSAPHSACRLFVVLAAAGLCGWEPPACVWWGRRKPSSRLVATGDFPRIHVTAQPHRLLSCEMHPASRSSCVACSHLRPSAVAAERPRGAPGPERLARCSWGSVGVWEPRRREPEQDACPAASLAVSLLSARQSWEPRLPREMQVNEKSCPSVNKGAQLPPRPVLTTPIRR